MTATACPSSLSTTSEEHEKNEWLSTSSRATSGSTPPQISQSSVAAGAQACYFPLQGPCHQEIGSRFTAVDPPLYLTSLHRDKELCEKYAVDM